MSDVFISYSRKNSDFARKLIDKLARQGKDTWVDWEGIPLTSPNWWMEIKTGIESADSFVFIMTPDSMASIVCNMELDYAIELRKRIIPVVYQEIISRDAFASIADFEPDEAMQERLAGKDPLLIARENWHELSHINWLFFREEDDFDESFDRLITTVETDLDYVKAHTRYLTRAQEWQRENQRSDLLLFGEEIDHAEDWLQKAKQYVRVAKTKNHKQIDVVNPLPKKLHLVYITESRNADKRRRRLARSAQISIAVLILVSIIGAAGSALLISNTQQQVDHVKATSDKDLADASTQVSNANSELTAVPPTLNAVATEVKSAQNFADSMQLAFRAQDIYQNGNEALGLALAYEASLIDTSPQTERILSQLAYDPASPRYRLTDENSNDIEHAVFSPDNKTILSASDELLLWDVETGEILRRYEGFEGTPPFGSVEFSPDGKTFVSGSDELLLWDVETGDILHKFEGHRTDMGNKVIVTRFSQDGKRILSAASNELFLWDVASGEIIQRFEGAFGQIFHAIFSPDGKTILSTSCARLDDSPKCEGGALLLWDVASGEIIRRFDEHHTVVIDAVFSPDGKTVLSGSCVMQNTICTSGELFLWDVKTGEVLHSFPGISTFVTSVEFSPDGKAIVTRLYDGSVILWDFEKKTPIKRFNAYDTGALVAKARFSPDGGMILVKTYLLLWDIEHGDIVNRFFDTRPGILYITFSPDSHAVLSVGLDGSMSLWDIETGTAIQEFAGYDGLLIDARFSDDGLFIYCAYNDKKIVVWDVFTGEIMREIDHPAGGIMNKRIGPNGRTVIAGSYDGTLILRDMQSSEVLQQYEGHESNITVATFSPDGQQFISGSQDGMLLLWDVSSGELLQRYEGHVNMIRTIGFSPDGQKFVSGSQDGMLTLWDVESGTRIKRLEGHEAMVMGAVFTPDGKRIVSTACRELDYQYNCLASAIYVWEVSSGEIVRRFEEDQIVTSLAVSPDGQTIVSGGDCKLIDPENDSACLVNETTLWRNDTIAQLQQWVRENRYLYELSCEQRFAYDLPPERQCVDGQQPPMPE